MILKCETILNIYTHRNTNVLCQIKVQPSNDNKQQNREWQNTCRCITQKQWKSFDKELKVILKVLRHKPDKCNDEIISTFSIKPNIEVKVHKSKLSSKMFYNIMGGGVEDNGSAEDSIINTKEIQQIGYVLEIILDFKPQPPSISSVKETQEYQPKTTSPNNSPLSYEPYTPSKKEYPANSLEKETQKYEPKQKTSADNICNNPPTYEPYTSSKKIYNDNSLEEETQKYELNPKTSPDNKCNSSLAYEPYTPSMKKCRANSLDGTKTPGVDLLEHESFEDAYLPKPIKTFPIPTYKPAPITEKLSSKESQTSNHNCNKNEVIVDQDVELFSPMKFRTIRSKVVKEKTKHEIEYIPKSQEIINAPEYFPTPIEGKDTIKNDKKNIFETLKEDPPKLSKQSINENYQKSQKNLRKRISKRLYKKLFSEESNQDKVYTILERKESSNEEVINKPRISEKASPENLFLLNISVPSTTESTTTVVSPVNNITKEKQKLIHHDTDHLARSPIKPKRLREEKSSRHKNRKKLRTQKCSPINTELFGTDDDDDDKGDDSNNDATNKKPSMIYDLFGTDYDATKNKSSILNPNVKILKNPHLQPDR